MHLSVCIIVVLCFITDIFPDLLIAHSHLTLGKDVVEVPSSLIRSTMFMLLKQVMFKVILYSYLILKKMNERIIDSQYINKYT